MGIQIKCRYIMEKLYAEDTALKLTGIQHDMGWMLVYIEIFVPNSIGLLTDCKICKYIKIRKEYLIEITSIYI